MKKILVVFLLMESFTAFGAQLSLMEEAAQLGTIAGLAEACGSKKKVEDYELIAARLIANKSNSDEQEQLGYRRYAEEKVRAMNEHKNNPQMTCKEILSRFEKLPIFKSVVYKDGSMKFYDGTFYPAKGIYAKKK